MSAKRTEPQHDSGPKSTQDSDNPTEFDEDKTNRDHAGRFFVGNMGSPANRDRELFRKHAAGAIKTLLAVMKQTKSHTARVSAARELLDRGYGRPPQGVELSNKQGEVFRTEQQARIAQLSDAELDQQLAELAAKAVRHVDADRAQRDVDGGGWDPGPESEQEH
jgi:hypothetical protein